jgi:hypothetical protein
MVSNKYASRILVLDLHTSSSVLIARARSNHSPWPRGESYSKGPSISSEAMVLGLVAAMGSIRYPGWYDNIGSNFG